MTNRMWAALLAVVVTLCAQSVRAQEESVETDASAGKRVRHFSIATDEALADYREWIGNEENVRVAIVKRGMTWDASMRKWYTERLAPVFAERADGWYVIGVDSGELELGRVIDCWNAISQAYKDHVHERANAASREATAQLAAQKGEVNERWEELNQEALRLAKESDIEVRQERIIELEKARIDLEIEAAGAAARLDAVREKMANENDAMQQSLSERKALVPHQRKIIELKIEHAQAVINELTGRYAPDSEGYRQASIQLQPMEVELANAQLQLAELDAFANRIEEAPVYVRLREMLIEAEVEHVEVLARKEALMRTLDEQSGPVESLEAMQRELSLLSSERERISDEIKRLESEVKDPIYSAYRFP